MLYLSYWVLNILWSMMSFFEIILLSKTPMGLKDLLGNFIPKKIYVQYIVKKQRIYTYFEILSQS